MHQIHACDRPCQRLCFQVTGTKSVATVTTSPDLSDPCMRSPPWRLRFQVNGTKTIPTVTTFIRSMHAIAPIRSSIFKLRHQDSCHCHDLHQIHQIHACDPPPTVPFSSYGTKTIATVTTFTRSIRSMHAIAPVRGSVFKLRHQDHRHCHHLYQIYETNTPAQNLMFKKKTGTKKTETIKFPLLASTLRLLPLPLRPWTEPPSL